MDISFFNAEHEAAFIKLLSRMQSEDCYHLSLAYLLTLDSVCREHLNDLFSFNDDVIKIEGLNESWQTGTSKKTTRLAFNLWNDCYDDGEEYTNKDGYKVPLPSSYYTPWRKTLWYESRRSGTVLCRKKKQQCSTERYCGTAVRSTAADRRSAGGNDTE